MYTPENYPHIEFDENGVCNYCNKYEKQKFLGEEALNNYLKTDLIQTNPIV